MADSRSAHVFRVDKFVVPEAGRDEFVGQLRRTHDLLAEQPGFVQDFLLKQSGGSGEFNVVTMVEWESQEAIDSARTKIKAMHEQRDFDPQELFARLDITADIATYSLIGRSRSTAAEDRSGSK